MRMRMRIEKGKGKIYEKGNCVHFITGNVIFIYFM